MTQTFNFELVSPEEKLISEPAWQVTIPGEEGDVGVRAGHMALVMSIRPGVVEVMLTEHGEKQRIFIAGGFADISQESCTVLAEQAVNVQDLNPAKLDEELASLAESLKLATRDDEKSRIESRIALVENMRAALRA